MNVKEEMAKPGVKVFLVMGKEEGDPEKIIRDLLAMGLYPAKADIIVEGVEVEAYVYQKQNGTWWGTGMPDEVIEKWAKEIMNSKKEEC